MHGHCYDCFEKNERTAKIKPSFGHCVMILARPDYLLNTRSIIADDSIATSLLCCMTIVSWWYSTRDTLPPIPRQAASNKHVYAISKPPCYLRMRQWMLLNENSQANVVSGSNERTSLITHHSQGDLGLVSIVSLAIVVSLADPTCMPLQKTIFFVNVTAKPASEGMDTSGGLIRELKMNNQHKPPMPILTQ